MNGLVVSHQNKFLMDVPVDVLSRVFAEALASMGLALSDRVDFPVVEKTFEKVKLWTKHNLKKGEFRYIIDYVSDQTDERFQWSYFAIGGDFPLRFDVHTTNLSHPNMTVETFMGDIRDELFEANEAIHEFNAIVNTTKPYAPLLDTKEIAGALLSGAVDALESVYEQRLGKSPSSFEDVMGSAFPSWTYALVFKKTPTHPLSANSRIVFELFEKPDTGWIDMKVLQQFRGVPLRYLLCVEEIPMHKEVNVREFPNMIQHLLRRANSSAKTWNWLVDGGHKQTSRIKNVERGWQ